MLPSRFGVLTRSHVLAFATLGSLACGPAEQTIVAPQTAAWVAAIAEGEASGTRLESIENGAFRFEVGGDAPFWAVGWTADAIAALPGGPPGADPIRPADCEPSLPEPSWTGRFDTNGDSLQGGSLGEITAQWWTDRFPCGGFELAVDVRCEGQPVFCDRVATRRGDSCEFFIDQCSSLGISESVPFDGERRLCEDRLPSGCHWTQSDEPGPIGHVSCDAEANCRLDVYKIPEQPELRATRIPIEDRPVRRPSGYTGTGNDFRRDRIRSGYLEDFVVLEETIVVAGHGESSGWRDDVICDSSNSTPLYVFSRRDRALLESKSAPACLTGMVPTVTKDGFWAVTGAFGNTRLQRFDANGTLVQTINLPPSQLGGRGIGIVVDVASIDGQPWFIILSGDQVMRINVEGGGAEVGWFRLVRSIAVALDGDGRVALLEADLASVQWLDAGTGGVLIDRGLEPGNRGFQRATIASHTGVHRVIVPTVGIGLLSEDVSELHVVGPEGEEGRAVDFEQASTLSGSAEWPLEPKTSVLFAIDGDRGTARLFSLEQRVIRPGAIDIGVGPVTRTRAVEGGVWALLPWNAELVLIEPTEAAPN